MTVFDSKGRPLEIDAPTAKGGEGSFCLVRSDPQLAVKIYHKGIAGLDERGRKLSLMVKHTAPEVQALAAWPLETVAEKPGGATVGFVMSYAKGFREAHYVYGIKDRKVHFPKADWRFLVRAASNMARAFATVHRHGYVVGDVNHSSVMVSPDARVKLIDCDSWQVTLDGQSFRNLVGEALHTAPELQGKSLASITRTANHDLFGLAVLVFELLFMGRHPFAGRFSGKGDPGLEENIGSFRFAYGPEATSRQMQPPPGSLPLESVSPDLAALFKAAFSSEGVRSRPSASSWVAALDSLFASLVKCHQNDAHYFWKGCKDCPWCRIEALTGVMLFNPVFAQVPDGAGGFDLALVWRSIQAVTPPGSPAPPSAITPELPPNQEVVKAVERRRWIVLGGLMLATLGCVGSFLAGAGELVPWVGIGTAIVTLCAASSRVESEKRKWTATLSQAQSQLNSIQKRWWDEAGDTKFKQKLQDLQKLKEKHASIPVLREQKMRDLERGVRDRQLHKHLDGFLIENARISGIGPGRRATLRSYGVESAADVTGNNLYGIPGFGPHLTTQLFNWRSGLEARFKFDPSKGVDPQDRLRVENEVAGIRLQLERELRSGAHVLTQLARQVEASRQALRPAVEAASGHVIQAEANVNALRTW